MTYFGLTAEGDLDCKDQGHFGDEGAGDTYQFFAKNWAEKNKCKVVHYPTQYSVLARDDYKRCVCDSWGNKAEDCGLEI